ncbi:MAG TPA: hypothetical protein VHO70_22880 [Chitinispirillaceae bacterium]|nr:hypothetical protein [Chitinispirillaceae bacterium]
MYTSINDESGALSPFSVPEDACVPENVDSVVCSTVTVSDWNGSAATITTLSEEAASAY